MTLIELLKNDNIEISFAGVCECREHKYDICLNDKYYATVHKSTLLKHNNKFRENNREVQE